MHAILEYVAIGVMLIIFLTVSFVVTYEVMQPASGVYHERIYTVAERLMDKIVLTTGIPVDWGTNIGVGPSNLTDFGLALNGTRNPYEIDPDKVMRLANLTSLPNPLLMNTTRLAQLLGIERQYGFRLKIKPMLNILITPIEWYNVRNRYVYPSVLEVSVSNYFNIGIPNVNVTGMYVIVKVSPGVGNQGQIELKTIFVQSNVTDVQGNCILNYYSQLRDYFEQNNINKWYFAFLIVHVNWYGFVSVAGYSCTSQGDAPVQGYIIGNYIFVSRDVNVTNIGRGGGNAGAVLVEDELLQAVPEYSELLNFTTVTWCRDSNGQFRNDDPLCNAAGRVLPSATQWYLIGHIEYIEKLSSHVFVFAQYRGNPIAIVINRIPSIDIVYGSKQATPANSVTIRRIVHLYNYPYIVELTVWRIAEGWP